MQPHSPLPDPLVLLDLHMVFQDKGLQFPIPPIRRIQIGPCAEIKCRAFR